MNPKAVPGRVTRPGLSHTPSLVAEAAAPNPLLWFTDTSRAWLEAGLLAGTWPLLGMAPRGEDAPVLVLPGLGATDVSTRTLRATLRRLGHHVHGWRLGRNIGPTRTIVDGMQARLAELRTRHGQPVSIVGWSLGGIFARQLARRAPDQVRQVITLGSPIRLARHDQSRAHWLYRYYSRRHVEAWELPLEGGDGPLPVPATSVYSRVDGIVAWQACLDQVGPTSENVEVPAAHFGFGHHPAVLWVVADRLAQPAGTWAPFRATVHLDGETTRP